MGWRSRTLLPCFLAALSACRTEDTAAPEPTTPKLVVYWTVDTLGATAAKEIGWCDRLGSVLSAHGLGAACLDGAVAPGSWTAESHTRLLWPDHTAGSSRAQNAPDCESRSSLRVAADQLGAELIFGADNPALYGDDGACDDGRAFLHEADVSFDAPGTIGANVTRVEEERAARKALDVATEQIAAGEPVVLFLNDLEAGGHVPRCWYDPALPVCQDLWAFAVSQNVVAPDADPAVEYLRDGFWKDVGARIGAVPDDENLALRGAMWGTIVDAADAFMASRTETRLDDLLSAVDAAGRGDELLLVILADHGENPCIRMPFTNLMNCEHGDLPGDFTARVPALISPASTAEEWLASGLVADGVPWAAPNLSWGLVDAVGAAAPETWPDPEPVGGASSWYCRETQAAGLRVEGDVSLRCVGAACGAWEWAEPSGFDWSAEPLPGIPEELLAWSRGDGGGNAFQEACGE